MRLLKCSTRTVLVHHRKQENRIEGSPCLFFPRLPSDESLRSSKDRRGTDGGTQTGTQELGNRGAPAQVTALRGWRQLCLPCTVLPPVCGFGCHISLDSPKSCSCIGPQGTHCCQVLPEARRGGLQQATGPGRKGGAHFPIPPRPSLASLCLKRLSLLPVTEAVTRSLAL